MKKIIKKSFLLAGALLATAAITACDSVKEDDRFIELPAIQADRAVLIEDFTGQNCLNCPNAHEIIEQLEEQYGHDKVIAVSIHGGSMAIPDKRPFGLMTVEGDQICNWYAINQFPMGVIDGQRPPVNMDQWATVVRNDISKPTDVKLEAKATLFDGGNSIKCTATVESSEVGTGKIQFWIVENGIVARQKLPNGSMKDDYVHNHVFRAQVFEDRGTEIAFSRDGSTAEGTVNVWKERWNVDNLEVVAFVSDNNNLVQQVVRVPVEKEGSEE